MTSRRTFISAVLTAAALPLLSSGQTCCAAAGKDAKKTAGTCPANLKATNATVIGCEGAKVKIKVKCAKCGFLSAEMELDMPTAEKPTTLAWNCPKCGHKQTVKLELT